ncbi:MAG: glycosyltransferase [Chitinophagaceae bacterium]|nr:MAG: glycosyltransferase [Chitinophagaceae bacterium]
MNILFIVPYPLEKAPSQRFRIEQFFPLLDKENIQYTTAPFIDAATWEILYGKGSQLKKVKGILGGYLRRLKLILFETGKYDVFVIHREAAPLGPPIFEWILAKILKKKYIFDYDDAIWMPKISSANRFAIYLRCFWKTKFLCRWAYINTPGNHFLEDYAKRSGAKKTILLPTVVDAEVRYRPATHKKPNEVLKIGWTGSHSTLEYLETIKNVLLELKKTHDFKLYVIADVPPSKELEHEFIPWNATSEIEQLKLFDIGIMPLLKESFGEGKCGFKLIQYMAVGIPGIASYTRANAHIVDHAVNGYICNTDEEWLATLKGLIEDKNKRDEMGRLAREKVVTFYSLKSQEHVFLDALRQCQAANTPT